MREVVLVSSVRTLGSKSAGDIIGIWTNANAFHGFRLSGGTLSGVTTTLVFDDAPKHILQRMRDHSGTHASAPMGENAEHGSQQADLECLPEALVRVSSAEHGGGQENAGRNAMRQSRELPLQVAAIEGLLTNPSRNRKRHPQRHFDASAR